MRKPDPENLRQEATPAVLNVEDQGAVFVADVLFKDSGWVRITEWNGTEAYLPPRRVDQIRKIEVEREGDEIGAPLRVADRGWRERAKNADNGDTDERRAIA